jgi:hypothetical protein
MFGDTNQRLYEREMLQADSLVSLMTYASLRLGNLCAFSPHSGRLSFSSIQQGHLDRIGQLASSE